MSAQASHCSHYQPPLQDIRFVQQHWLGAEADWRRMPAHEALDQETADMVVEAAGRFCADVLAPLNGPADLQGCRLEEGRVRTPDGFPEAYAAFVEAGWPALACAPEAGGQGLFAPLASTLAAEGLELASSDALAAHNRRAGEILPDDWGQELPPAIERIARTLPAHEAARSPTIILSKWVTLGIAQQQAGIEEAFSPYDDYFDNNPADRDGLVMRLSEFCYFELPHGPEAADWDRVVMDAYAATVQRPSDMAPERDLRGSHARVLDQAA
mgnify:CR=1 FL=1